MKKLLVGLLVLGSFSSFGAELRVNCSSQGEFVDYKKTIFGLKKIASNMKNVCPGIASSIRVNNDGSVFSASCGYQASDSGYNYSINTRRLSSSEVEVIVALSESNLYDSSSKVELHKTILNTEHVGFTRALETDVVAFKDSKRKFTKLEKIEVSCSIEGQL